MLLHRHGWSERGGEVSGKRGRRRNKRSRGSSATCLIERSNNMDINGHFCLFYEAKT